MTFTNLPEYRPVYRSLHRPLTICGVDRRLFFLALLVANDFRINVCPPAHGDVEALQEQSGSTLAYDEAIAIAVEWSACALRLIVPSGQCPHCIKSSDAQGRDHGFRPSCENHVRVSTANGLVRLADRVG